MFDRGIRPNTSFNSVRARQFTVITSADKSDSILQLMAIPSLLHTLYYTDLPSIFGQFLIDFLDSLWRRIIDDIFYFISTRQFHPKNIQLGIQVSTKLRDRYYRCVFWSVKDQITRQNSIGDRDNGFQFRKRIMFLKVL